MLLRARCLNLDTRKGNPDPKQSQFKWRGTPEFIGVSRRRAYAEMVSGQYTSSSYHSPASANQTMQLHLCKFECRSARDHRGSYRRFIRLISDEQNDHTLKRSGCSIPEC